MNKHITPTERQGAIDDAEREYLTQLIEAAEDDAKAGNIEVADDAFWEERKRRIRARRA